MELHTKLGMDDFDLVHIPTRGLVGDLWRAFRDKLGFTTDTANQVAAIVKDTPDVHWYAHSYGGVAFTEAIRVLAKEGAVPRGESVTYLAGANNHWVTNSIMRNAGVRVDGYHQSWWDAVPNVAGANSLNPIQWVADIAASWTLFAGPNISPHTYPPVQ